jgi:hypothetical protein
VTTLTLNSVGNFYSSAAIARLFRADVVYSGGARAVASADVEGNCNNCHTEHGASGPPGRVVLP